MPSPRKPAATDSSGLSGLLAAAARGEEGAWREIIARYGRRVYALARSRCRRPELAEEIAQSVFATVASKLIEPGSGYAEQGRFESWLFRVTMNRVRDYARRAARQASPVDPASLGGLEAPARPRLADDDAELTRLREAMGRLADADREVIELRHHGGLSFKQMSELLNEPLGTLLARHHRALRKLKQLMADGDSAEIGADAGEGRRVP